MKESKTPIPYVKRWNIGNLYHKLDILDAKKESGALKWPVFCPIPLSIAEGQERPEKEESHPRQKRRLPDRRNNP